MIRPLECLGYDFTLQINAANTEHVSSFEYIGMIIGEALMFSDHVDHLHKKISCRLGILCMTRKVLNNDSPWPLYNSLLASYLDYDDTVYSTCIVENLSSAEFRLAYYPTKELFHFYLEIHIALNLLPLKYFIQI